jgi:hypothetical protein
MLPLPVGLTRAVYGPLVLLQMDEGDGQLGKVGDVVVQQLGRLVHPCQMTQKLETFSRLKFFLQWHTRIRFFSEKNG